MADLEALRRAHFKPSIFGSAFNPRPSPDVFGRRQATPREVELAMNGEFYPPQEEIVYKRKKRR